MAHHCQRPNYDTK